MPVQPQLVLLQKTLLNIEGLGRQLYPDLDLWQTAHPYLEQWLKRRFSPKSLWRELKRQAPEWLEKFPEVPHLLLDTLNKVNQQAGAEGNQAPSRTNWSPHLLVVLSIAAGYLLHSVLVN